MRFLLCFIVLFIILGCEKGNIADSKSFSLNEYKIVFTHNGADYSYKGVAADMTTLVTKTSEDIDVAVVCNYFDKEELALTTVLASKFAPGSSDEDIRAYFSGEVPTTLNDSIYAIGVSFFAPFFFASDNGGKIAKDGEEFSELNFLNKSEFYPQGNKQCFDVEVEFLAFANTGDVPCGIGTEYPSCVNVFTGGLTTFQICL